MLDATEISQVHDLIWRETPELIGILKQPPGTYRYLCEVHGIVMFTHHRIGTVLHEY
jgi:hypothetical protein